MKKTLRQLIYIAFFLAYLGMWSSVWAQSCEMQFDRAILPQKSGSSAGVCLTHDQQGNIYVAGTFENQIKLGNHLLTGAGNTDIFIAKYNPNGELLWVQSAGGEGKDEVSSLSINENESRITVIGRFENEIYFSNKTVKTPSPQHRTFFCKLNQDGKIDTAFASKEELSSKGMKSYRETKLNSKTIAVMPVDFCGGEFQVGSNSIDTISYPDSKHNRKKYVMFSFDSPKNVNWERFIESNDKIYTLHAKASPQWGAIFTGVFKGTMQIGDVALTAYGEEDGFVFGINEEGKITFARHLGGLQSDAVNDALVLPNGDVFLTGYTVPNAHFGNLKYDRKTAQDTLPTFFLARLSCGVAQNCHTPEEFSVEKISEKSVSLSWVETAETQAYDLQNKTATEFEWQTVRTPNSPITVNDLKSGQNYQFRLRKVCAEGFSPFTEVKEAKTLLPVFSCEAPRDFSIRAIHPTFASVQWFEKGEYSSVETYHVHYRKKGEKTWLQSQTSANAVKIQGLEPVTEYEVKVSVSCKNNFGGDTTAVQKFTTIRLDECAPPDELKSVHILHRSAHIRWSSDENATGFRVQWKKVGKGDWQSANTTLNGIVLFGLNPDTPYEVRLRSKCGENSFSPYSEPIVFKTLKDCEPTATLLVPDVTLTTAWVVWDSVPNGKRYELFYKAKQDIYWKNIVTTNRYTQIKGLNPETPYELKLRVNCGDTASSAFGPVATLTTLPNRACGTVENVVILPGVDHAVVRWKPAKLAGEYVIQWRCTNTSLPWTSATIKDVQTRQFTIPNLTAGANYAVKIITKCETVVQPFERTFSTMTDAKASATLKASAISAYPNPAKERLRIDYNIGKEESATLEIYDLVGRRVFTKNISASVGVVDLNVSEWESGVYFCRLFIDEERQYLQKIAVQK